MSVVLLESGNDLLVRNASVWHRMRMHLLAGRWDRDLAAGLSPDTSVEHSLRAHYLALADRRMMTARALWRELDEASGAARRPLTRFTPHTTVMSPSRRAAILDCALELQQLAARLDSPGPVAPRGLACSSILVTNGAGPLLYSGRSPELGSACREALRHLEPNSEQGI